MTRSRLLTPALLALSTCLLVGSPAVAAEPLRESVQVTGTGEVFGEPDTLTANFAVETSAATVGDALNRANTAAAKMRDTLVRAGLKRADLQTSNAGVSSRVNDQGTITAYAVNLGLSAKSRDLPGSGALIAAAVRAGGDAARLNGVTFSIEDAASLRTEARKKAFSDARGKAELYAREAGRTLGRVINVSEADTGFGGPVYRDGMAASDSSVPIEPGRQRVAVTVSVEWAFL